MLIRSAGRLAIFACLFAAVGLPVSPALAQEKTPENSPQEVQEAAAPRSISDIIRILDHYKPDPAAIDKARATLKLSPPETDDRGTLFQYYFDRGIAASRLSDAPEALASFRKARDNMTPEIGRAHV